MLTPRAALAVMAICSAIVVAIAWRAPVCTADAPHDGTIAGVVRLWGC